MLPGKSSISKATACVMQGWSGVNSIQTSSALPLPAIAGIAASETFVAISSDWAIFYDFALILSPSDGFLFSIYQYYWHEPVALSLTKVSTWH